jgi:hypothetical protein
VLTISEPILSISEALAVLHYKQSLSFTSYKLLSEWLDCYTYIIPSERTLVDGALYVRPISRTFQGHKSLWEFTLLLEHHYTETEQSNIIREIQCQLIQDSKTYPTPHY